MKKIGLIGLLVLLIINTSGCIGDKDRLVLKDMDKEYIEELSTYKQNDRDKMYKYMYVYINHMNSRINDEDLEFLRGNSSSEVYEDKIKWLYFNDNIEHEELELDNKAVDIYYDGGEEGHLPEVDEQGKYIIGNEGELGIDEDIPEESGVDVIRFYYFFRDNTYGAKVSDRYGNESVIYFKVDVGKVVDVYEL